jgi:hypothetical protein
VFTGLLLPAGRNGDEFLLPAEVHFLLKHLVLNYHRNVVSVFSINQKKLSKHAPTSFACISFASLKTLLLTPWSRVLFEKLTDSQPVKKFRALYGTRRFITAFTTARHLSILSRINAVHAPIPHLEDQF